MLVSLIGTLFLFSFISFQALFLLYLEMGLEIETYIMIFYFIEFNLFIWILNFNMNFFENLNFFLFFLFFLLILLYVLTFNLIVMKISFNFLDLFFIFMNLLFEIAYLFMLYSS